MAYHLTTDLEANYARFLARVVESGSVWILHEGGEGYGAMIESNLQVGKGVHLLFSAAAYARRHTTTGEWAKYQPKEIALAFLLDVALSHMANNDLLVGVDYNNDMAGFEVEPLDLKRDIEAVIGSESSERGD